MPALQPICDKEEFARRGDEIYNRDVRSVVEPAHDGKIVVIDIVSGTWELDADERTAFAKLRTKCPDAQVWVVRVGSPYLRRFGRGGTRTA